METAVYLDGGGRQRALLWRTPSPPTATKRIGGINLADVETGSGRKRKDRFRGGAGQSCRRAGTRRPVPLGSVRKGFT